ncbi:MAG TPA: DUF5946 family protein [Candidatus Angelobacter sp.]|nr:DUF5946 family protein [Candidatus Angelobacter sp.]
MQNAALITACPGCGVLLPEESGPTHRYAESSATCWKVYGEVLAREYSDPVYLAVHRLTVDAFAAQHPGQPSPQSIQSVAVHLISLRLIFERGYTAQQATSAIGQAVAKGKGKYAWLTPPSFAGRLTVADVHKATNAEEHIRFVRAWAESVWKAWSPHHDTVREWASLYGCTA